MVKTQSSSGFLKYKIEKGLAMFDRPAYVHITKSVATNRQGKAIRNKKNQKSEVCIAIGLSDKSGDAIHALFDNRIRTRFKPRRYTKDIAMSKSCAVHTLCV